MRIDEILKGSDEPVFSFEFFPPKTPQGADALLRTIEELKPISPGFVSVTYGAMGSNRGQVIELVRTIKHDLGLNPMAHLSCTGHTRDEIAGILDQLAAAEIDNVLALRGDPPAGEEVWTKTEGGLEYSRELVELIREGYDFSVAAAAFPETHIHATSAEDDLRHLKAKVDAGVDFLVTQLFFDNAAYFDFVERARAIGIDVPIIPGILPITNVAQLDRITTLCGAIVPEALRTELDARDGEPEAVEDFGVAYATLQCSELLAGGAPGIHFYTLNRSTATREIYANLGVRDSQDLRL